ncbi:MAG: class I SAM-dependent methyltransferase [Burkholderiales bacterium]
MTPTVALEALDARRMRLQKLSDLIQEEIAALGGWMDFARFMELALHHPDLGYYSTGDRVFGRRGDFVTAPELSGLFGATLARQVAQVLGTTGGAILEIGAGTGRLACDLLASLETVGAVPASYLILEPSAGLRKQQKSSLGEHASRHLSRVGWLNKLPKRFNGIVICNEVLDALPVHLVIPSGGGLTERGLRVGTKGFEWSDKPLTGRRLYDTAGALKLPDGYLTEINLAARDLVTSIGSEIESGVLLIIDYGFGVREYYHPQRSQGTLMCHTRHHSHSNPLIDPGGQDISTHVDFSAIASCGIATGLELLGYTSQAEFLIGCGILELLSRAGPENPRTYIPLSKQVQMLLNPSEMGELFKVMALGRGLGAPLLGYSRSDRRRSL